MTLNWQYRSPAETYVKTNERTDTLQRFFLPLTSYTSFHLGLTVSWMTLLWKSCVPTLMTPYGSDLPLIRPPRNLSLPRSSWASRKWILRTPWWVRDNMRWWWWRTRWGQRTFFTFTAQNNNLRWNSIENAVFKRKVGRKKVQKKRLQGFKAAKCKKRRKLKKKTDRNNKPALNGKTM